jgi:Ca2+-binding RTX toxin-like protein
MDADLTAAGNQGFTFLGMTAVSSAANAGELRAFQYDGNTYLLGGVDGDGRGDFQIEITGLHTLTTASLAGLQNAILTGTNAADTIIGTSGNDILNAGTGNDRLYGVEGNDVLVGGAGDDALYGYFGDDVLEGGLGKDRLAGGDDADRFVYRAATDTPFGTGRDLIVDWDRDDVIDLSAMDADLAAAGNQGFTFLGMTAVSSAANAGELRAFQYDGNTFLLGGVDGDGRGDFQIEITGLHTLTTASLAGLQNAILTGTNAADTIIGTSGNDILVGNSGDDRLYGLDGDDILMGATGDDVLEGGSGKDRLSGGEGADRFVYRAATETPFSADRDLIVGWESGDVIDLSAIDADLAAVGNQGFTFLGMTGVTSAAGAGELRAFHHNGNTYLLGGVDGDGRGDFQIEIAGLQSLGVDQIWLG